MNNVSIRLQDERSHFNPGDTITGTVVWSTDRPTAAVELRLFWITSGVSPQQVGMIKRFSIPSPSSDDSHAFRFVLPDRPWSFQGRLAALCWMLEAVVLPIQLCARCRLTIGPGASACVLHRAPPAEG
jgi:hypothetical protein